MSNTPSNFERMIELAESFFETRSDPDQIAVDQQVMDRLHCIHPASMGEVNDGNGPVAWTIVIPTTRTVMDRFLAAEITERELLDRTPVGGPFEAIYLCSALVLPEHRGNGYAKRLVLDSIAAIRETWPISALFTWSFSDEGASLAQSIASKIGLPLFDRK